MYIRTSDPGIPQDGNRPNIPNIPKNYSGIYFSKPKPEEETDPTPPEVKAHRPPAQPGKSSLVSRQRQAPIQMQIGPPEGERVTERPPERQFERQFEQPPEQPTERPTERQFERQFNRQSDGEESEVRQAKEEMAEAPQAKEEKPEARPVKDERPEAPQAPSDGKKSGSGQPINIEDLLLAGLIIVLLREGTNDGLPLELALLLLS